MNVILFLIFSTVSLLTQFWSCHITFISNKCHSANRLPTLDNIQIFWSNFNILVQNNTWKIKSWTIDLKLYIQYYILKINLMVKILITINIQKSIPFWNDTKIIFIMAEELIKYLILLASKVWLYKHLERCIMLFGKQDKCPWNHISVTVIQLTWHSANISDNKMET